MRTLEDLTFAQNIVDVYLDSPLSSKLKATNAMVLVTIGQKISGKKSWAMTLDYLVTHTKLSVSAIKRALVDLTEADIISIGKYRLSNGKKMNDYSLHSKFVHDVTSYLENKLFEKYQDYLDQQPCESYAGSSVGATYISDNISDNNKYIYCEMENKKSISGTISDPRIDLNYQPPQGCRRATKMEESAKKVWIDMPDDFQPTEQHRILAREYGVDAAEEVIRCREHYKNKGWKKENWVEDFTKWLCRGYELKIKNKPKYTNHIKNAANPQRSTVSEEWKNSKRNYTKPDGRSLKEILKDLEIKSKSENIEHPVFTKDQNQERYQYLIKLTEIQAMSLTYYDRRDRMRYLEKSKNSIKDSETKIIPYDEWSHDKKDRNFYDRTDR